MQKLITIIDTLNDRLGRWSAWLALAMVLVMGVIVILRYAFQIGSIALQESVMYLNALIFTLGAAYTLQTERHTVWRAPRSPSGRVRRHASTSNPNGRGTAPVARCSWRRAVPKPTLDR